MQLEKKLHVILKAIEYINNAPDNEKLVDNIPTKPKESFFQKDELDKIKNANIDSEDKQKVMVHKSLGLNVDAAIACLNFEEFIRLTKSHTNLDLEAQSKLEESILNNVTDEELQVASVLIDPETGAVQALTGGMNYAESQYNRALQSKRQVGSTMKPFLYYAALENGMTSSSTFFSEQTNFVFANNKIYSPSNYNDIYANKDITMAAALAFSDNIYAVKTHLFLGEDTLLNTAKKAGINGTLNHNPSLALGTSELVYSPPLL